MVEIARSNPPALSNPGGRYSQVVKAGNLVFIAGQTATNAQGEVVGVGDVEAQARQVYANIEAAVRSVGGTLANLVKTVTYITSRDSFPIVSRVRQEVLTRDLPTSTLLIVSGLARPEFLVEVEAVAVVEG